MDGRLEAVYAKVAEGETVMSPDHVRVVTPNPVQTVPAAVDPGRSRGLEGLAASRDGRFLYGMLEGPLWDVASKYWENQEGQQVLRVLDFSLAEQRWTGRHWKYVLSPGATAIGDFNMIDASTALVIERDNGEGTHDRAYPTASPSPNGFHDLAKFKRVVKIEMSDAHVNGPVSKIGYVDLIKIQDAQRRYRKPLNGGVLTFPFCTIENVDMEGIVRWGYSPNDAPSHRELRRLRDSSSFRGGRRLRAHGKKGIDAGRAQTSAQTSALVASKVENDRPARVSAQCTRKTSSRLAASSTRSTQASSCVLDAERICPSTSSGKGPKRFVSSFWRTSCSPS